MYKVEEFFGKPEELEEYLNKKCVVEHLTISQMVSPVRNSYLSEEEIKNLIRENHKWEDTYYMVSDGLTLNIKSI